MPSWREHEVVPPLPHTCLRRGACSRRGPTLKKVNHKLAPVHHVTNTHGRVEVLTLFTRWNRVVSIPRERGCGTHYIRGWVGPTGNLNAMERENLFAPDWSRTTLPRYSSLYPSRYTDLTIPVKTLHFRKEATILPVENSTGSIFICDHRLPPVITLGGQSTCSSSSGDFTGVPMYSLQIRAERTLHSFIIYIQK
jgi:hypothetical protein